MPATDSNPSDDAARAASSLEEVAEHRSLMSGSRRWASRRRRELEARSDQILRALDKGLSPREIREELARGPGGLSVGRWMMEDVIRHIRRNRPASTQPSPTNAASHDPSADASTAG